MDNFARFKQDMEYDGRDVEEYRGRFYYDGPAVRVERDDLQSIIRATDIILQWDQMGKSGLIVYPLND